MYFSGRMFYDYAGKSFLWFRLREWNTFIDRDFPMTSNGTISIRPGTQRRRGLSFNFR